MRIDGPPGRFNPCSQEIDVRESIGTVLVNLTRTGSLEQEISVVCYTEDDTARGNEDYAPRYQDSLDSEVTFPVNQSTTTCALTVINDTNHEGREMFKVHLTTSANTSFVTFDPTFSSLCVYISYDENDGKCAPQGLICAWIVLT